MSFIGIVHYHKQQKYSNIKILLEKNKKRILEAKALGEEMKEENHHELQCFSIPEMFSDSNRMHIDPCYKNRPANL